MEESNNQYWIRRFLEETKSIAYEISSQEIERESIMKGIARRRVSSDTLVAELCDAVFDELVRTHDVQIDQNKKLLKMQTKIDLQEEIISKFISELTVINIDTKGKKF